VTGGDRRVVKRFLGWLYGFAQYCKFFAQDWIFLRGPIGDINKKLWLVAGQKGLFHLLP